jgi:Delta7-sterol 5-desaturase
MTLKLIYVFAAQLIRYVLFAGIAWLIFYTFIKKWRHKRIHPHSPSSKQITREILYSLSTFLIFTGVAAVIICADKYGYTKLYHSIHQHSITYFISSVIISIILHDTWFYWTHRFMHLKWVFPYVHKVHHLSLKPSPWASFAFHPIEALIEAGILPLIVILIPIHPLAILIFLLYMTFMNVLGHLGHELFPSGFVYSKWTAWHNTTTHHDMHHGKTNCNYGLYFNIWDKIMDTNHKHYLQEFESIAQNSKEISD